MNATTTLYRGQARAIGDALDAAPSDRQTPLTIGETENILRAFFHLIEVSDEYQAELFQELMAGRIPDTQAQGQIILQLFESFVLLADRFRLLIQEARAKGHESALFGPFEAAAARAAQLHQDFLQRWPLFDPEELAAALKAMDQGEVMSEEEMRLAILG